MKNQIAKFLHRSGISADFLTVFGLVLAGVSGWLVFQGVFFWAAAALLVSGLVDLLDGAVARVSGKQSAFGGIFDSTLDRYGDGFVLGGLALYCAGQGRGDWALLALSAWMGSFCISYVRARAECEIDSCRVGFWERGERIGVLTLGLAANNPGAVVWILGIATHWTVFQRVALSYLRTRPGFSGDAATVFFLKPGPRSAPAYWMKIAALAALLLFVYVP